jgi:hypothetical protein
LILLHIPCSAAGYWLFARRRWLDPRCQDDLRALNASYDHLCACFPPLAACCARSRFLARVAAAAADWDRCVRHQPPQPQPQPPDGRRPPPAPPSGRRGAASACCPKAAQGIWAGGGGGLAAEEGSEGAEMAEGGAYTRLQGEQALAGRRWPASAATEAAAGAEAESEGEGEVAAEAAEAEAEAEAESFAAGFWAPAPPSPS